MSKNKETLRATDEYSFHKRVYDSRSSIFVLKMKQTNHVGIKVFQFETCLPDKQHGFCHVFLLMIKTKNSIRKIPLLPSF